MSGFIQSVRRDLQRFAHFERARLSAGFVVRMILLTQGFQFVLARRLSDLMVRIPVVGRPLRRIWWWWTCRRFGAEIAIGATVGDGLYIPHPYGIVLGVCTVGEDVAILQNVTVGARGADDPGGAVIGRGSYLSAGAVLVGPITLGDGAVIGANAVVLADVPAGATAVGIPARIVARR
jgi:serine O-acetyltransferase